MIFLKMTYAVAMKMRMRMMNMVLMMIIAEDFTGDGTMVIVDMFPALSYARTVSILCLV